ncbi:MAG: TIGR03862 family flavoprotein [Hyphomicrobiaceae bacterium]
MTDRDLKRSIAIVGAGPAGLMAADVLASAGHHVTIYDRMPAPGRKLLMAGRGGLNLTHSEPIETFITRYGPAADWLAPIIRAFPPDAVKAWADGLGAETFTGSSGRVFPKALKASPLLRAWLVRLGELGVGLRLRHRWLGIESGGALTFETPAGTVSVATDATVLALGGASWPRLGSDASFVTILAREGIDITPLLPANMGFEAAWSEPFRNRFAGQPLKRVRVSDGEVSVMGEAMIVAAGIEGGAIYALSERLRDRIARDGTAEIEIDLRPDLETDALAGRLSKARAKESLANRLRKAAGMSPVAIGLLREGVGMNLPGDPILLAAAIKAVPIGLASSFGIARAISSAGGVRLDEVDGGLMLHKRPGVFLAGEMLDWSAPTGGYLLQASLSTGVAAAKGAMAWLGEHPGTG